MKGAGGRKAGWQEGDRLVEGGRLVGRWQAGRGGQDDRTGSG
jgi:hypothetical protein